LPEGLAPTDPEGGEGIRSGETLADSASESRAGDEIIDGLEGAVLPHSKDLLGSGDRQTGHHAKAEAE